MSPLPRCWNDEMLARRRLGMLSSTIFRLIETIMCLPYTINHSWGRGPLLGGPPGFLNGLGQIYTPRSRIMKLGYRYGNVFVSKHPKFRANHSFVCQNWGFIRSTSSVCTQFHAYFTHLIQPKAFFVGPLKLNNYIRKAKGWRPFYFQHEKKHHVLSIVDHILIFGWGLRYFFVISLLLLLLLLLCRLVRLVVGLGTIWGMSASIHEGLRYGPILNLLMVLIMDIYCD